MMPFAAAVTESAGRPATVPRILVAGIGNIFLGDDAFGVEVVRRWANRRLPLEARVVDFGIRGLDLTYALLDGYEAVILVDACPRGGSPGTLYVLETELDADQTNADDPAAPTAAMIDTHAMDPVKVLRLAAAMGSKAKRVLLVGCEPSPNSPADETGTDLSMEISAAVRAAIDPAAELVESLVARLLAREDAVEK